MGREPSSQLGGGLVVSKHHLSGRLVVSLGGRLELDSVEDLAACADQICRSTVRAVVFDVTALSAVDDAGARTLAAACKCLATHGVTAQVRGICGAVRQAFDRLGLVFPEPPLRGAVVGRPTAAIGR
jgi:anti-anti-sigma regulatory factor